MANNQLLASDNFASGSLAAGWSAFPTITESQIVSQIAEPTALSINNGQIWTGLSWPNDQISEITIASGWVNEAGSNIVLACRSSSLVNTNYTAQIGNNQATIFKVVAGTPTQLVQKTGLTIAAGDVWSFAVFGAGLFFYQNGNLIAFWPDATITSGTPGFYQSSSVNISHVGVASFRGYSAISQDGIWQKQGVVLVPVAADINTGVTTGNSGTANASRVLFEGNAQLISGAVFKIWFGSQQGINYAESPDGKSWTRRVTPVLTGYQFPQIFKSGNTYYLYCQSTSQSAGQAPYSVFSSSDGVNWTLQNATGISRGSAGAWDATAIFLFTPAYIDVGGTWHALYSGVNASNVIGIGLATSSDGINWTKYVGNPVYTQNMWVSVPYLINGTWYMWGAAVPAGSAFALNPSQGAVIQSPDLINWSNKRVALRMTQMSEGVNTDAGGAYPDSLITVGGKTYMYYDSNDSNTVSNTGSIWQVNLAIAPAPMSSLVLFPEDAVQQVVSDNFNRANGSLGANWTTPTGGTALQIASNLCEPSVTSHCVQLYTAASFGRNQYCEATITTLTGTGASIGLVLLGQTGAASYYYVGFAGTIGTLGTLAIWKRVNGTFTQLSANYSFTPQIGDVLRFAVVQNPNGNNLLTAYQNGFSLLQYEDFANTFTSGFPGLDLTNSTAVGDTQVSLWAGGNANVIPSYGNPLVGWSPLDCRQAVTNFGPAANTGVGDTQGNDIFSATNPPNPPFTGNSQASDNSAIPPADCRVAGSPKDCRVNIPVNSRVNPDNGGVEV